MKKEKGIKLALISMLSNPDIELKSYSVENQIYTSYNGNAEGHIRSEYTGIVQYVITVYNPELLKQNEDHAETE